MKLKKKIVIAALIAAVAGGGSFPLGRYISDRSLFSRSEDEIYAKMCQISPEKLIEKINRFEKKLPDLQGQNSLMPFYTALIDKADCFSGEQLIALIRDKDTLAGIDSAFVQMYVRDGYNPSGLRALLDDPEIAEETKVHIVSKCNFSSDELCDIFRRYDCSTATIALQKLTTADSEQAMKLVDELIQNSQGDLSDEKYKSVCLGIAQYYEEHQTPEDIETLHAVYIPLLKQIYDTSGSERVKDQAVYAMARICDYELFTWLIENQKIDRILKVTVIERNTALMKQQIEKAKSTDDIRAVIEAMQIHPILEIGEALQAAVDRGDLPATDEMRSLIEDIRNSGIHASDKYE